MDTHTQKPFLDYATFLRERYGETVYRVPVDAGFGCPNRRPDGTGGCLYCAGDGARAPHVREAMPLEEQVRSGIRLAAERYGATAFIAYFQAYTATHADPEALRAALARVLAAADFRSVVLSTRPDCLPPAILDVLTEYAATTDVRVELGIQTAHDATLARIARGHTFACSQQAVALLHERGIPVSAHVILGLPGESPAEFSRTAEALAELPLEAVKLHNLHVVQGTELAAAWRRGEVRTMDEHEYGEVLIDFLRRTPADRAVMRLTTDTPRHDLLAPKWWMSKAEFLDYLIRRMGDLRVRQGDLVGGAGGDSDTGTRPLRIIGPAKRAGDTQKLPEPPPAARGAGTMQRTLRPLLAAVRDTDDLPDSLRVLDVGFGLGTLALQVADELATRTNRHIHIVALGTEPSVIESLRRRHPEFHGLLSVVGARFGAATHWGNLKVYWGDPRRNIFRMRGRADIILLEPPRIEPFVQFFTLDFLRRLARFLEPRGILIAASADAPLRGALRRIGLQTGSAGDGKLGTIASPDPTRIGRPLSERVRAILADTLSGIPYRDRHLNASRAHILRHRDRVVARMRARGTPKRLQPATPPARRPQ